MIISLRRAIGVLQLVGGVLGLGLITFGTAPISGPEWARLSIELMFVGFLLLLSIAGILLLRGRTLGTTLSLVAQALQVPQITSHALSYHLQAPAAASLSFSSNWNVGFAADLSIALQLRLGQSLDSTQIAVNLLALACIYILLRRPRPAELPTTSGLIVR